MTVRLPLALAASAVVCALIFAGRALTGTGPTTPDGFAVLAVLLALTAAATTPSKENR